MYKIIGGDKVEYGPETAEQIRAWVADGRANGQTLVQAEGSNEWRPLASYPELIAAKESSDFSASTPSNDSKPFSRDLPADIWMRDYELNIGDYINQSFAVLQRHFALILSGTTIWLGIQVGLMVLGMIPAVAMVASFASLIVTAPLMAGLYQLLLQVIRAEPASKELVLDGFRERFLPLFLGHVVSTAIMLLAMLPGLGMLDEAKISMPDLLQGAKLTPEQFHAAWIGSCVAMVPFLIMRLCWLFAVPLIMDKKLSFLSAMHLSMRKVTQHWWRFCALSLICLFINFVGFACCLVGLVFTIPLVFLIEMHAYEDVFRA